MKYSREKFILAASRGSVILIKSSDKKCLKLKNLTHSLQFSFSYKSSAFSYFIFLVNKKKDSFWKFLRNFYFLNKQTFRYFVEFISLKKELISYFTIRNFKRNIY